MPGALSEVRIWNAALPINTGSEWSGLVLTGTHPNAANLIGHWRMDEPGAVAGGTVGTVVNAANPGTNDGLGNAAARFSADVPAPFVFDPVSSLHHANAFSLDAGAVNATVTVADHAALNTVNGGGQPAFTVEFFLKLTGEPVGYDTFARRLADGAGADSTTVSDRQGWQMDIDSGTTRVNGYGRARARMDMPGTPPPVFNAVSAVNNTMLFVDTPTGSGLTSDYTASPADPQLDGNGVNDLSGWFLFALTYNGATRQMQTFLRPADGNPASTSAGNVVTLATNLAHPTAPLVFGKFTANAYGLLVDEVRYSSGVLTPAQFLQTSLVPEPSSLGLLGAGLAALAWRRSRRA